MTIAVIGTGNVGQTLTLAFKKAGHSVIFGVREKEVDFKGKSFAIANNIPWDNINLAVERSEVTVLCTPGYIAHEVALTLGDVSGKILIDAMNSAFSKATKDNILYQNTTEAVLANCNCTDVVKCFNTTGFENMANPLINNEAIDMFAAGTSEKAKSVAMQLAKEIGFGKVWDFGGNDKITLLEELAMCWINLAIIQKNGRQMGIKFIH